VRIRISDRPVHALAGALVIAIFMVDLLTPVGIADWLCYLVPLLMVSRVARPKQVFIFVATCSVLIGLGFVLSPAGIEPRIDIFNRILAIAILWLTAVLLIERQRAEEALSRANRQLQVVSRRLVEVQEDERRALARDLHDEAGQALTALVIGLGLLEKDSECTPAIASRTEELKAITDGIMRDLHRLAVNLRPSSLDRLGLAAALRQYTEQFSCEQQATVRLETRGLEDVRLPPEIETALYRIAQESLTNVARYAHATKVGVALMKNADRLTLMVEDDGVGFDVEEALQRGRLGLVGMRERVDALGGSLKIESAPGAGTTVLAQIPLEGDTLARSGRG